MRDLFEQIVREGEPAILQLVAEKRQEGVDLDFKEKANASTGEPNRDDRRVLGITLSALSNSIGGLLVWGVEARKNADQIDCAIATKPISHIDRFKAEVVRLLSQAIMPRHEGITVEAIRASTAPGSGYLLLLVERSERRPHRCEFGEKQYFKRIGDSSVAMEHDDIEDSFKRMVVPQLTVKYVVAERVVQAGGLHQSTTDAIIIKVLLVNTSTVTARFPYLGLAALTGATIASSWASAAQGRNLRPRYDGGVYYIEGTTDHVSSPRDVYDDGRTGNEGSSRNEKTRRRPSGTAAACFL